MPELNQANEFSCTCVLGVTILSTFLRFRIKFGTLLTVMYFFFNHVMSDIKQMISEMIIEEVIQT